MRCGTTDLLIDQCAHCRPMELGDARDVQYVPERTIVARFDGRCPGCYGRTEVGDTIHLVDGDWLCDECVAS